MLIRSIVAGALLSTPLLAEEVNITPDMPSVTIETAEGSATISRIQDQANELDGE